MSISTRNAIFGMLTLTILFFALIGIGVEISGNADTKELKLVHVVRKSKTVFYDIFKIYFF